MKRISMMFAVVALAGVACGKSSSDPNTVGGDPDLVNGGVGVVYNTPGAGGASATITANDGGVATIHVVAPAPTDAALRRYYDLIPADKKVAGGLAFDTRMKLTTEGIQDTQNKDHALHTVVKYGANVGDQYVLTKSDGSKITRTVTAKSTEDDYFWGGMLIKVIEVEQSSAVPGVKKFVWYANHKFGLVALKIVNDDDTSVSLPIY